MSEGRASHGENPANTTTEQLASPDRPARYTHNIAAVVGRSNHLRAT